jgi:hypothetical protein
MLTGWISRLTKGGGAADPTRVLILNHNSAGPREPGDITLFASVDALAGDIHAPDIASGGYFACDALGRVVTLAPIAGDADQRISASVSAHATHAQLAVRMLRHHLRHRAADGVPLDVQAIDRETDIVKLIAMVPKPDIVG